MGPTVGAASNIAREHTSVLEPAPARPTLLPALTAGSPCASPTVAGREWRRGADGAAEAPPPAVAPGLLGWNTYRGPPLAFAVKLGFVAMPACENDGRGRKKRQVGIGMSR